MAEPRQQVRARMILTMCFLLFFHQSWSAQAGSLCVPGERDALLDFKAGLTDPTNSLSSSWRGMECCRWTGVVCSNRTGHVVTLQMHARHVGGEIRSSLLTLRHLKRLDLSGNDFGGEPIPELIGALGRGRLTHLDLSYSNFGGRIPPHLGNLSNLVSLKLEYMAHAIYSPDIAWVSRLTKLQVLRVSQVDLGAAIDWTHAINMLPSLMELDLRSCGLQNSMPSTMLPNLTSLETLTLDGNSFNTSLGPKSWVWDLPSLQELSLTSCGIDGQLPDAVGKLTSIRKLSLASNKFDGMVPLTLKNLKKLQRVDLSSNFINMDVAELLHRLAADELQYLDLGHNRLTGSVPVGIRELINLKGLSLTHNNLHGTISQSIGELHALESVDLSHNEISGEIPTSISALTSLNLLDLSYNNLTGAIPTGNQLQALDDPMFIYIGNPGLCGPPLPRSCLRTDIIANAPGKHDRGMSDVLSLYLSMCIGFVAGLWIVFFGFLFKRRWRVGWFSFTDRVYNRAYVQVAVGWACLARKMSQG
ncbi:LRR receptor-like serine/threonine-protein kinase RCH1 [Hordeum vulgare]|uniref:Predicted protein n=1 Tax=Hordeum vulgare subsp. vulgare TaxID=112509 RepID=F2CRN8_HORVV|nr:receptor-like protein EIX1 [Hordeum vulgare subsp. vulgare]KAE8777848.1 LRR receptor-like serine/threonine-protein kinase RCH1 [Hordeum vulgare]BAJ85509.1 predicted protein [Hordeum vulgare subsp. vulgare]BAJ88868.1 predicted protein [Hordeum vulgare subsp. vulgare]